MAQPIKSGRKIGWSNPVPCILIVICVALMLKSIVTICRRRARRRRSYRALYESASSVRYPLGFPIGDEKEISPTKITNGTGEVYNDLDRTGNKNWGKMEERFAIRDSLFEICDLQ
jgi:hypothetical protein